MTPVSLETRRRLNDHRRRTFRGDDDGGRIAFICECGAGECTASVLLTHAEYDVARARGDRVLHRPHGRAVR